MRATLLGFAPSKRLDWCPFLIVSKITFLEIIDVILDDTFSTCS